MKSEVVVGMPVYNSARWLKGVIESWLGQTRPDFRLIISDNASTDESFELAQSYARRDPRVEVHRNARNIGICGNFRRAFDLGRDSRYFMWASSHDFFAPTTLEHCVAVLDATPDAVLCHGRTRFFEGDVTNGIDYDEDPPSLDNDTPATRFRSAVEHLKINNVCHGVIRTAALAKTRVVEDYYSADNVMVAQLSLMGKLIQVPEILFYRRMERATATVHMSIEELSRHWDPDGKGMAAFTHWKIMRGYLRAVLETDLPWTERRPALLYVLRCIYWGRSELLADLAERTRALVRPNKLQA